MHFNALQCSLCWKGICQLFVLNEEISRSVNFSELLVCVDTSLSWSNKEISSLLKSLKRIPNLQLRFTAKFRAIIVEDLVCSRTYCEQKNEEDTLSIEEFVTR